MVRLLFGVDENVAGITHCVSPQISRIASVREFGGRWGCFSYENLLEIVI